MPCFQLKYFTHTHTRYWESSLAVSSSPLLKGKIALLNKRPLGRQVATNDPKLRLHHHHTPLPPHTRTHSLPPPNPPTLPYSIKCGCLAKSWGDRIRWGGKWSNSRTLNYLIPLFKGRNITGYSAGHVFWRNSNLQDRASKENCSTSLCISTFLYWLLHSTGHSLKFMDTTKTNSWGSSIYKTSQWSITTYGWHKQVVAVPAAEGLRQSLSRPVIFKIHGNDILLGTYSDYII